MESAITPSDDYESTLASTMAASYNSGGIGQNEIGSSTTLAHDATSSKSERDELSVDTQIHDWKENG